MHHAGSMGVAENIAFGFYITYLSVKTRVVNRGYLI